jgi:hypothetical protein
MLNDKTNKDYGIGSLRGGGFNNIRERALDSVETV